MAVYKELKTNTWKVYYRYTDWQGERKQTTKRGFLTKREALAWEREQREKEERREQHNAYGRKQIQWSRKHHMQLTLHHPPYVNKYVFQLSTFNFQLPKLSCPDEDSEYRKSVGT